MTQAQDFVQEYKRGVVLAKARKGLTSIDTDAGDDFKVYIFRDNSRAGYKRGNGRSKSQVWVIEQL